MQLELTGKIPAPARRQRSPSSWMRKPPLRQGHAALLPAKQMYIGHLWIGYMQKTTSLPYTPFVGGRNFAAFVSGLDGEMVGAAKFHQMKPKTRDRSFIFHS